ncbi:methyl-accepting chemotaxis protein [Caulobacter sp. S45]|uniref:methyl-accepting chemotaxis protein n=1 Tax=Caulobacter sp. S45 TaxID=1641861 RepID=UPI00131DD34A|nr:methyl-accepting chemotaxis protein [Caulobacter sp. S45]
MQVADVRIAQKLIASFAAIVFTFAITSGIIATRFLAVHGAVEVNQHSFEMLRGSQKVLMALVNQQDALRGYVAHPDPQFLKNYERYGGEYDQSIAVLRSGVRSSDQLQRIDQIETLVKEFHDQGAQSLQAAHDPARIDGVRAGIINAARLLTTRDVIGALEARENQLLTERTRAEKDAFSAGMATLALGSVAAVAIAVLAGFSLFGLIAKPIISMTAAMRRLASGDNTVEIPAVGRRDEVGQMAEAVQAFKAAALEKLRLEGQSGEQRRAAEAERARNEADKAQAAERQTIAMEGVAGGLESLADGDLVFRLSTPFAAEYEKLRTDFNAAMDKLQQAMRVVSTNTTAIRSGAGEISVAADDLSRRTEQQAASLEQTAAALDQITATVRKTAEGAIQARGVVGDTKVNAERSGEVVRDAIGAMSGIEQSSRQIGNIISVIDEIAFQTNLLALNAGVEAARAGDAGRGFAVVASEVRALAQRSAEAAKEIKGLISASAQHVASGVSLVGQTGKALERIVVQVTEINIVVGEIAASAQEQAAGLHQVNTAINQMDQVTQQNAAMVEQSTAASHNLTQETEELAKLISQFKTGAEPQPTRHNRPTTRPTAPAMRAKSASAPAMKTIGRGGAARRPTADADGWEEF